VTKKESTTSSIQIGQKVKNLTLPETNTVVGYVLLKELNDSFIVEWHYNSISWREINKTKDLKEID